MRKLMACIMVIALSFSLYACSNPSSKISLDQRVSLGELNCSLPADWSKTYGSVETASYAPAGDEQATFALLFYSVDGMDLIGGLNEAETWIKLQNEGIEIHSVEDMDIEGHSAKKLNYTYPNGDGTQSTCKSIMVDVEGDLAALSLTTEAEAFSDNEELFDAILASISFVNEG